ncbi:MAG: HTH domain-containing protein [Bacteroidales bacterium]|nr:MAG: HTH domain-containing protein [Bacteroidales bacterium]
MTVTPEEIYTDTSEKTSEKIIELIRTNKFITIKELAESIGISNRSIERNIKKLQNENKLKRVGADKGGHWELKI